MNHSEGLILQGCDGDLNEWVDGINEMLTESGILLGGTKIDEKTVSTFTHDGLTNLLFPFTDDVQVNMGKLAMWRLQTHDQFGGTWLSDYVDNKLGGFIESNYERRVSELNNGDVDISPDFQCDQTGGFPTSLAVNWQAEKVWLVPNESMISKGDDMSFVYGQCEDFGIRDCGTWDDYNSILESLGEDAVHSAYHYEDMDLC